MLLTSDGQPIKPLSKSQLMMAYECSEKTLAAWLKPFQENIGEYNGKAFYPLQVKTIFDLLGEPPNYPFN